jgi:hypothetical protein
MNDHSHDSRCPYRISNRAPSDYKWERYRLNELGRWLRWYVMHVRGRPQLNAGLLLVAQCPPPPFFPNLNSQEVGNNKYAYSDTMWCSIVIKTVVCSPGSGI